MSYKVISDRHLYHVQTQEEAFELYHAEIDTGAHMVEVFDTTTKKTISGYYCEGRARSKNAN